MSYLRYLWAALAGAVLTLLATLAIRRPSTPAPVEPPSTGPTAANTAAKANAEVAAIMESTQPGEERRSRLAQWVRESRASHQ